MEEDEDSRSSYLHTDSDACSGGADVESDIYSDSDSEPSDDEDDVMLNTPKSPMAKQNSPSEELSSQNNQKLKNKVAKNELITEQL